jgi:predicted short-subunit dehydrogenase-like oxidoreductase (DUF2520 family)
VQQYRISFAGAGNVAGALCRELYKKQNIIEHIVSKSEKSGRALASTYNATWSDDYIFPDTSEIIIVAVPDNSISSVLEDISCNETAVLVHTAGSIGLDIFPPEVKFNGVLYPLQTFSPGRMPDLSTVPFFIEASDENTLDKLKNLAGSISNSVNLTDSEHRRLLHLAAVFICNFTNHMFTTGKNISLMAGFPFEVLKPLILETVDKAIKSGPENSQTGPAIRHDMNIINKHLDLLSFSPDLKDIYDLISKSIIDYYDHRK